MAYCSRPLQFLVRDSKRIQTACMKIGLPGFHRFSSSLSACFLFPGQGSQHVGMCSGLVGVPGVSDLFSTAKDCLGYDVLDVCLNGPAESLNNTLVCQPAVVLASLAAMQKLEPLQKQGQWGNRLMLAGYSVGEITALIYSEALTLDDGLKVVGARAAAMHAASCKRSSGMATILGARRSQVEELCEAACASLQSTSEHSLVVSIACHLADHCFVVGGDKACIEFVVKHAKDFGASRPVKLVPVSGAFHTVLMQSAQDELRAVLEKTSIQQPRWPVLSNVTARPYSNVEEIKHLLVEQLVMPVHWSDIMTYLIGTADPETEWFEVGPDRQLARMLLWASRSVGRRCTNVLA